MPPRSTASRSRASPNSGNERNSEQHYRPLGPNAGPKSATQPAALTETGQTHQARCRKPRRWLRDRLDAGDFVKAAIQADLRGLPTGAEVDAGQVCGLIPFRRLCPAAVLVIAPEILAMSFAEPGLSITVMVRVLVPEEPRLIPFWKSTRLSAEEEPKISDGALPSRNGYSFI